MKANRILLGIILVALLLLFRHHTYYPAISPSITAVTAEEQQWHMVKDFKNKQDAAELLARTNASVMELLRYLKKKYHIDEPDDVIAAEGETHAKIKNAPGDLYNIVNNLLDNYNPEVFYETDPRNTNETSYTVDKGARMYICLRDKVDPNRLVDQSTLLFVMLHEASHIANYKSYGHGTDFWTIFKFILHEAEEAGIYKPINYAVHPVNYCGLIVQYSPLYDNSLPNLWS